MWACKAACRKPHMLSAFMSICTAHCEKFACFIKVDLIVVGTELVALLGTMCYKGI